VRTPKERMQAWGTPGDQTTERVFEMLGVKGQEVSFKSGTDGKGEDKEIQGDFGRKVK
jgi:hypothetical protein